MRYLRRILVPTDFSRGAEDACLLAEHLAARHDADVHVLHVPDVWTPNVLPDGFTAEGPPTDEGRATAGAASGRTRRAIRPAGSAVDGVLSYAHEHDVDVIVMGTHGRRGVRDAVLGSTSERVVRLSDAPVLTVRAGRAGERRPDLQRVLVAVDFAEPSRSLVAHARHLAAGWGAAVDLVYVVEEPHFPHFFQIDAFLAAVPDVALRSRDALQALAETTEGPDVPIRCQTLIGDPASMITQFAEAQEADLILLATHGWTGFRRLILGNVAEAVVRTAPCPVLTLKSYGKSLVAEAAARAPSLEAPSALAHGERLGSCPAPPPRVRPEGASL